MPIKGGKKLAVRSPNEFRTATTIGNNLTNVMLSKAVRYKNVYHVIPFHRRYKQTKLSYAVGNHYSETPSARVMTLRGTHGGDSGIPVMF